MLNRLFESLKKDKNLYLNAQKGSEFEERIMKRLQMNMGFTRILKNDINPEDWKIIRKHTKSKLSSNFIDLPNQNLKKTYIYQPYGSQDFPDFIIFTEKKVIPLEIKFSSKKQSKPIWNSNVPRANAFYIFGSYGLKDLTFFLGDDILTPEHRKSLYGFFDSIRNLQNKIRKDMPTLDITNRGFTPYIRAAFDQKKHKRNIEINFFTHPKRKEVESLAIEKSKIL